MHYNLLFYGVSSGWCFEANNSLTMKDSCLKKIIRSVKPDIFTANEIKPDVAAHDHILNNIMNTGGITYYKRGEMSNLTEGSKLSNGIFYNSEKFVLLDQTNIPTTTRDINVYDFCYNALGIESASFDTAFLTCIVIHLEPGSGDSSIAERTAQINLLMNHLDSLNKKANYLLMGDFNVYSGAEPCFQNLVSHPNSDTRFYDPVNMIGAWHDDIIYSNYHTQSTYDGVTGCHSGGGMDDRFDFILQSEYIKNGASHFQYLPGSYKVQGQDGNHFNKAINDGTNNSASAELIDALYFMSDHLPVTLDISVDQNAKQHIPEVFDVLFPNPVTDVLHLSLKPESPAMLDFIILNVLGQQVYSCSLSTSETSANFEFPVGFLNQGIYFLTMYNGINKPVTKKFMKK